jgi:hypothetical protein
VIAAVAITFGVLALWNIRLSVSWYMTVAKSHAWFEGALLVYFVLRGEHARARQTT